MRAIDFPLVQRCRRSDSTCLAKTFIGLACFQDPTKWIVNLPLFYNNLQKDPENDTFSRFRQKDSVREPESDLQKSLLHY